VRETRGDGTPRAVVTARELRRTSTEAEEHLWDALRGRRLKGLKFRRQHPYASFILDFFCVEYQVAIELGCFNRISARRYNCSEFQASEAMKDEPAYDNR